MVEFSVTNTEVIEVDGMLGLPDLKELVIEDRPNLLWPNFHTARARAGHRS